MVSPPDARAKVPLVEPREAAANAAVELIQPGMTVGLGSGRAVWAVTERLEGDEGPAPYVTDEGHYTLDCATPADTDPATLDAALAPIPGVVEHGLFLDMASLALLGSDDGNVERLGGR